jgi:hypothetical protein
MNLTNGVSLDLPLQKLYGFSCHTPKTTNCHYANFATAKLFWHMDPAMLIIFSILIKKIKLSDVLIFFLIRAIIYMILVFVDDRPNNEKSCKSLDI